MPSLAEIKQSRQNVLAWFAQAFYGPLPDPPDALSWVAREVPMASPEIGAKELTLTLKQGPRLLTRKIGLFLPLAAERPLPLIIGLNFTGPAGALRDRSFALSPNAVIDPGLEFADGAGRLRPTSHGIHAKRWPIAALTRAGFAVMLSCYGDWVPDHSAHWRRSGIWPLLFPSSQDPKGAVPGAISLWAWALRRMVDLAQRLGDRIDGDRIFCAGHSRLGKAALWAAANDPRITGALVNNSGCAGAALSRRKSGETLAQLTDRFPHWLSPSAARWAAEPTAAPFDQNHLMACVHPRRLYIASASEDLWADPKGEYLGLSQAAPAWVQTGHARPLPKVKDVMTPGIALTDLGHIGWHLREGAHDLTGWDWARFFEFLHANGLAPEIAGRRD